MATTETLTCPRRLPWMGDWLNHKPNSEKVGILIKCKEKLNTAICRSQMHIFFIVEQREMSKCAILRKLWAHFECDCSGTSQKELGQARIYHCSISSQVHECLGTEETFGTGMLSLLVSYRIVAAQEFWVIFVVFFLFHIGVAVAEEVEQVIY